MASSGFNGKQFETAARRRLGVPLTFDVLTYDFPDDEDEIVRRMKAGEEVGTEVTVTMMIDPRTDLVTLGVAFGSLLDSIKRLGDDQLTQTERLDVIEVELPKLRAAIGKTLTEPSRAKWDKHGTELEVSQLSDLIQSLTQELSGVNPTRRGASSDGASETGSTSTDGAPVEESTPATSPSPDA